MVTLALLLIFTSFYLFYLASQKTGIKALLPGVKWFKHHPKPAKATGLLLLIISVVPVVATYGTGSGILMWFISLMTVGSLVILLSPLGFIRIATVSAVFAAGLVFEVFIF